MKYVICLNVVVLISSLFVSALLVLFWCVLFCCLFRSLILCVCVLACIVVLVCIFSIFLCVHMRSGRERGVHERAMKSGWVFHVRFLGSHCHEEIMR